MAVLAKRPRNRALVLRRIIGALLGNSDVHKPVGANTIQRARSKVWESAGVPSGAIPAGMIAYDLILDTTNDDVYRYISATTYVKINATS